MDTKPAVNNNLTPSYIVDTLKPPKHNLLRRI